LIDARHIPQPHQALQRKWNILSHIPTKGREGIQSSPQIPPPLHGCGGHPSGAARPGTQGSQYNKRSSQNYKRTLNLFFVDLEPAGNNKNIYDIMALQNKIIQIEPPRVNKRNIPQCARCQQYSHTRTYCNKLFACAKCGGPHNSKDCSKRKDTPAKCALCGGNHSANYKGCELYHNIIKGNNIHRTPPTRSPPKPTAVPDHTTTLNNLPNQQRSYAEVVGNRVQQDENSASTLKTFLEDFKLLFAQLLQQNSLILNMLTTLLNKPN